MKQLFKLLLVTIIVTAVSCKQPVTGEVKVVTTQEMKSLIEMDDVQLVDVRTKKEFETEHIQASQNIDVRSPNFDEEITRLDKDKPVLVYCRTGKRSTKCAEKLKDAGFVKIYNLSGGITKWKYEGLPTNTKS